MIRITVEMVPSGDDERARMLAQGVIVNDGTGTLEIGNYYYGFTGQIKRGGRDPGIQISGTYKGFPRRREDVWSLIYDCLNQGDQGMVKRDGTSYAQLPDEQDEEPVEEPEPRCICGYKYGHRPDCPAL